MRRGDGLTVVDLVERGGQFARVCGTSVIYWRWGSVMSSSGNRGLPRGFLDGSEGVRDSCWMVLECWASG